MFKVRLSSMQRSQVSKKILLVSFFVVLLLLILPQTGLAQDRFGLTDAQGIGLAQTDFRVAIVRIIQIILGFLGIVAVILVLYAGFIWMTSVGDQNKIDKAKKILTNAVIGIIIILSAYTITAFIIGALQGSGGAGGGGGGAGGGGGDDFGRWGIGVGPISSVYPSNKQTNVPINVSVAVTFKEVIEPATICGSGVCDGSTAMSNISICQVLTDGVCVDAVAEFGSDQFTASVISSSDNKTFTISPSKFLGFDDLQNRKFKVTLGSGIETVAEPGRSVFTSLIGQEFAWQFTTNGDMDLDPPAIVDIRGVYPYPDGLVDLYDVSAQPTATKFEGTVSPSGIVEAVDSAFSLVTVASGSPEATLSGNYGGTRDGNVDVVISGGGNVTASWPGDMGTFTSQYSGGALLNIGPYGLAFNLAGVATDGNSWSFSVTAHQTGDRIEVLNNNSVIETYVFGQDIASPADYMATVLAGSSIFTSCGVQCLQTNTTGEGSARYDIKYVGSGVLNIAKTDGTDQSGTRTQQGAYDAYRNTIISINFTEAINPTVLDKSIIVRREGAIVSNYTLEMSNQYRTVELVATDSCGQNSCGENMFCWPVDVPTGSVDGSQNYTIEIVAGTLINALDPKCQAWGGIGDGHGRCVKNIGGNDVFYSLSPNGDGLTDMSLNSFNGSFDTYSDSGRVEGISQGQSGSDIDVDGQSGRDAYYLNAGMNCVDALDISVSCDTSGAKVVSYGQSTPVYDVSGFGDNFKWSFYMSSEIDDQAPLITTVLPTGDADINSSSEPVIISFDRVMRSSTLRPGWNYGSNNKDRSQRYVVLQTISQTALPIGYWVRKVDIDNNGDGWADFTQAQVSHNNFDSFIKYGPLVGSGVQSATQNCFLPSAGPEEASKNGENCQYDGNILSADCVDVSVTNPASYGYLNCTEITDANECSDSCKALYYDINDPNTDLGGSWVLTKDFPTNLGDGSTGCCLGTCVVE